MKFFFRILVYIWTFPNTMMGLPFVLIAWLTDGTARRVSGVIEVSCVRLTGILERCIPFTRGVSAMTLGHVVIGRDEDCLDSTRLHERVHVRQYEILGPLFIPAYLLASFLAYLKGADPYMGNWFERKAYEKEWVEECRRKKMQSFSAGPPV